VPRRSVAQKLLSARRQECMRHTEMGAEKMAKSRKTNKTSSKPSVKVRDLRPNKDPKGGKVKFNEFYLKIK